MTIMHLFDIVDPEQLRQALDAGLVSERGRDAGLLGDHIVNYTDKAMYTPGAWDNPAVRACRGIIVNHFGYVVARPWAKFFNYGQPEAGDLDLDAPVEITDKLDGSLGIVHWDRDHHQGLAVATRGSFNSEQAHHATALIRSAEYSGVELPDNFTPLVEIVYPENRIVCDYGERDELVLLGGVWIETGEYVGPREAAELIKWPGPVTQVFPGSTLREALQVEPRPGAEGLCVRYLDRPHIVKIKQEDYVRLHKLVFGLTRKKVWRHMVDGGTLEGLLDGLPDELHGWVIEVYTDILDLARHRESRARFFYSLHEGQHEDRKSFAQAVKGHYAPTWVPLMFALADGKDIMGIILRQLEPKEHEPARVAPTSATE